MNAPALVDQLPEMRSDWNRVGNVFSVRFSVGALGIEAEWIPRLPTPREFRRQLPAYRSARDRFIADVAKRLGRDIVCVEL